MEKSPLKKERIQRWDNIKFFLIFLVVLGHIADIYANVSLATGVIRFYIYTFHMPLFLFVSGLFSKKNIKLKRWRNIFSYLVLYLFIKVLDFFAKWAATGRNPGFSLFKAASVPWYAFCLFAFSVIIILIDKVKPAYVLAFSVILACVAGYDNNIGDFLCLSRIIVFFPFFYAGYIIEPAKLNDFLKDKRIVGASVAVLISAAVVIACLYGNIKDIKFLFTGRNPYRVFIKNAPYAFVFRLICYAVSALMGFAFMAVIPDKIGKGKIAKIGARSVQIYSLHFAFKLLWFGLVNDRFHIDSFFTSKLLIYELLVAVVIFVICALPFWEPFFKKLLYVPSKEE